MILGSRPSSLIRGLFLGLLLVGSAALTGPSPASAGPSPDGTGPSPDGTGLAPPTDGGGVGLELVSQSTWLGEGDPITIGLAIADASRVETVSVSVYGPVSSRAEFRAGLEPGSDLGPALDEVSVPLALVPATADGTRTLRLESGGPTPAVQLDAAGVHPVRIAVSGPDEPGAELLTHVVRLSDDPDTLPLRSAVIVPFHDDPAITTGGSISPRPGSVTRLRNQAAALERHPDVALTVVPTPETVDSIDTAGLERVIDRLRSAVDGRQVAAGPYVRLSLDAWVANDLIGELEHQLLSGSQTTREVLAARPDPRAWVSATSITPAGVGRLAQEGRDTIVLAESDLEPLPAETFPITLTQPFELTDGDGRRLTGVAADDGLRTHINSTGSPVLDAQRTLADMAVIAVDRPGLERGVALSLPVRRQVRAEYLETLLIGLEDGRLVRATTVDELVDTIEPATSGGQADPGGEVLVRTPVPYAPTPFPGYPANLRSIRRTLEGYAQFVGPNDPSVDAFDRRILASGSIRLDRATRSAYLSAVSSDIAAVTAQVKLPEGDTVTLTSREGTIPLTLRNDDDRDLTVAIEFEASKLDFPDGPRQRVVLRPGVNRLEIPVTTRSTGVFPLDVRVSSPDGVLIIGRTRLTVRSTAVSGVGIVLSVGAGLVLLVWWIRTWRGRRAATRRSEDG